MSNRGMLGPYPVTLRGSNFSDATNGAGVSLTTGYASLGYFRIPLGTAYQFAASTQFSTQQHYWSQGLVTYVSTAPAVSTSTGIELLKMDSQLTLTLALLDQATAGDVPTIATTAKTSLRYFQNNIQLLQDQYLVVSVQAASGQTVAPFAPTTGTAISDILIKGQRWVQA